VINRLRAQDPGVPWELTPTGRLRARGSLHFYAVLLWAGSVPLSWLYSEYTGP
jgi:hypothetical protein